MLLSGLNFYSGGTIVSAGTLLAGTTDDQNLPSGGSSGYGGNSDVAGAFGLPGTTIFLGDANTAASNSSPSLMIGGAFTVNHPIVVTNLATTGTYTIGGSTDANATFSGAITVNEPLTISQVANSVGNALTFSGGIVSGGGSQKVTFAGPGNVAMTSTIGDGSGQVAVNVVGSTLTLSAANTYSGATTVSNGTLLVNGSISSPLNIFGGTIGGSGTISGEVTNAAGGNFAPGADNSTAGTRLNISGDLTLQPGSTNVFLVSVDNANNDSASISGTVTYGGTLTILTNATDATPLAAGNSFVLFNAGAYAGSFTSIQPPPGPGLAWSNDSVNLGQFDVVVATTPPAPVAGFSAAPTNIFVTQTVTFTDASSGSITNWMWNFGDGISVTNASNASVNHSYLAVGTNTVSLVVKGAGGTSTNTRVNYIVVKSKPVLGKAVLVGGNLVLSGVNGPAGQQYRILSSTNVALPLASWTPLYTNTFNADGSYGYTNSTLGNKADFLLLVSP
jgi:autotransporter-associated beta strand protein